MSGFSWPVISAAGLSNRPAALLISGMTRQLALIGLEALNSAYMWYGADYILTMAEIDEIKAAVAAAIGEIMETSMIGAIVPYFGPTEPEWGLICDGRTMLRADYPELWDMGVYPYKGDTWFYLPDMRSRIPIGQGQGQGGGLSNYSHLQFGGVEAVTLTMSQIPPHSHQYYPPVLNIDLETPGVPDLPAAGVSLTTSPTSTEGGGGSHTNIQPYLAMHYVIITPKP